MNDDIVRVLYDGARHELFENILPFWRQRALDNEYGGFYGEMNGRGKVNRKADKGLILNTRLLWTFSAVYRRTNDKQLLQYADRAYEVVNSHFIDPEFGGSYWMVDYRGRPRDTSKKIYGQAFTVYALAEYVRAVGLYGATDKALKLFRLIEDKAHDRKQGGYFETYNRDWTLAGDQRLSDKDLDVSKSMNTHLHVLEAYSNLYRIWPDELLRTRLEELLRLFVEHIIDPQTFHFRLFFDEKWQFQSYTISFGHDIEGSWLLCEAADVLGQKDWQKRTHDLAVKMAAATLETGTDRDGAIFYEAEPHGLSDADKHWWPQAEAVVGFLNAYSLSGQKRFLEAGGRAWRFITEHLVDRKGGEWFWKTSRQGEPDRRTPKISAWKSAYHNSRACLEIMTRIESMLKEKIDEP